MFPPEAFGSLLVKIANILDARSIRFALTGGMVSAFYMEPRYTQDADLVVDRDALLCVQDAILSDFQAAGYLLEPAGAKDAIRRGRQFQMIHRTELLKFDFYPRELVPGELERSVQAELFPGVILPITSRADLILSKLIWIGKGSHKSRRDVRQLMRRISVDVDERVRQVAEQLSLLPLLEEVLAESEELE